ncbi:MAG: hypothetical protein RL022_2580, partial [Chloroflexota bacterium]
ADACGEQLFNDDGPCQPNHVPPKCTVTEHRTQRPSVRGPSRREAINRDSGRVGLTDHGQFAGQRCFCRNCILIAHDCRRGWRGWHRNSGPWGRRAGGLDVQARNAGTSSYGQGFPSQENGHLWCGDKCTQMSWNPPCTRVMASPPHGDHYRSRSAITALQIAVTA